MRKSNGSKAGQILLWTLGAAVAGFVIHSIPDIVRYMKIRAM